MDISHPEGEDGEGSDEKPLSETDVLRGSLAESRGTKWDIARPVQLLGSGCTGFPPLSDKNKIFYLPRLSEQLFALR